MKVLPKIKEYSKEELLKQFENGEINIDFMCEYIVKRDRVYNKLIDEVNFKNTGFNEIREYINTAKITKDGVFLVKESTWGQEVLQIINKYMKEDD